MWRLEYSYDNTNLGDIFPLTDGVKWSKERNAVGTITFDVSLKKLYEFCLSQSFDIQRIFTPIKSSVILSQQYDVLASGDVHGGWLAQTPSFTFGAAGDTRVEFTFVDWLGLTAGAFLIPPLSYNNNFNVVAHQQTSLIIERTFLAGDMWPLSLGVSDTLPVVEGTLDAPKTLKDFLLERADNTTGTGSYDVYVTPDGVLSLHERYGVDLSSTVTLSYPDLGNKYDLKEIIFPAWDNYVSDIFLTGAGNGYASTSGAEGAAIFSTARNEDTIDNTGYWQYAVSESDISIQQTLDDKATAYVKDTDKPFSTPSVTLDGDKFKTYSHDQGGELWLGDTVMVDATGWVEPLLPLSLPVALRIDSIGGTIDTLGHSDITLGLVADV